MYIFNIIYVWYLILDRISNQKNMSYLVVKS